MSVKSNQAAETMDFYNDTGNGETFLLEAFVKIMEPWGLFLTTNKKWKT